MQDDLAWGVCDRTYDQLREGLSRGKGSPILTNTTYLPLGPELAESRETFEPLLSILVLPTNRSRINGVAIILVHDLRDKIQVSPSPRLTSFVDEFDLWGIFFGHQDEVIRADPPDLGPQGSILYPRARSQPSIHVRGFARPLDGDRWLSVRNFALALRMM